MTTPASLCTANLPLSLSRSPVRPSPGRWASGAGFSWLAIAVALVAWTGGCGDDAAAFSGPAHGGDTGGTGVGGESTGAMTAGGGGGADGGGAPAGPTRQTISGDATWTVTFDATAQAAGAVSCAYTRHYVGVEDRSAPWLCPACEVLFRAEVELVSGADDCYPQVSELPPEPVEWIGYGGGTWWRANGAPATEQGAATVEPTAVSYTNAVADLDAPMGGMLAFDVAGTFAIAREEGDPNNGWAASASYACGWSKSDAAAYDGDYTLSVGGIVPDGLFKDSCGDTVRLHDFAGIYLIFDMAAVDCPACDAMADEQELFVTDMAAQGVTVHVITMLAPSLGDPMGDTRSTDLVAWKSTHHLSSPVLADRGWSLSLLMPVLAENTAYPGWIVVAPDLRVLDVGSGYQGFDEHIATILANEP